jgi:hypothetical protein
MKRVKLQKRAKKGLYFLIYYIHLTNVIATSHASPAPPPLLLLSSYSAPPTPLYTPLPLKEAAILFEVPYSAPPTPLYPPVPMEETFMVDTAPSSPLPFNDNLSVSLGTYFLTITTKIIVLMFCF